MSKKNSSKPAATLAPAAADTELTAAQFGARLRALRKNAGVSVEQLAGELEIARTTVYNWEQGTARPDVMMVRKIMLYLHADANEYLGLSPLSSEEKTLLRAYRALDSRGRRELHTLSQVLLDEMQRSGRQLEDIRAYHRKLHDVFMRIKDQPAHRLPVAAGTINTEWDEHPAEESLYLWKNDLVSRTDDVYLVSGDSMEPVYYDGDLILVEYCHELPVGEIGVFYVPGIGGVVKQAGADRLHSLNPAFDDIVPDDEGARLIGRVLGTVTDDMVPSAEDRALYMEACEYFA